MKPIVINAKAMKNEIVPILIEEVNEIKKKINRVPKLVIVSASDDRSSELYMSNKVKTGKEIGIDVQIVRFDNTVTQEEIEDMIMVLSDDDHVDGIIVQLPIYEHLNKDRILSLIPANKDADGFSNENLGRMFSGKYDGVIPCTAKSVYEILKYHKVKIEGKRVCIIGRGLHTAKSLASLLINDGATVTVCNSKTKDMDLIVLESDIVISSVGKYKLVRPNWLKRGSVLIGIGIDYVKGKQETDYDIKEMQQLSMCSMVSDRINSVGAGTVLFLIENTIKLCKNRLEL